MSAPVQHAAVVAFEGNEEIQDYLRSGRRILKVIADYVHGQLQAMDVTMPPAQGGFYLFSNFGAYGEKLLMNGIQTSVDLCERLLEETGIALLPGSAFGRPLEEYTCRLSFVDFDGKALLDTAATEGFDESPILAKCPKITSSMNILKNWLHNLSS